MVPLQQQPGPTSPMKINSRHIALLSLLVMAFYLVMAALLHRQGYEHSEALFYSEKLKLLFGYKENQLLTIGTTFPTTVFLVNIVFSPFGYVFAPIASSILMMSILVYTILSDIRRGQLNQVFLAAMVMALFLFHPQFVFAAISGRNIAAVMLFLYLLFRQIFNYYRSQTTYYLSITSVFLGLLIFTEIKFLWLVLSFFPFIVMIALEGLKVSRNEPVDVQYVQALNNRSQRRKLVNRTVALYLIIFLLPLSALVMFRMLNQAHAGLSTYFLTGVTPLNQVLQGGAVGNVMFQGQMVFPLYLMALAPLYLLSVLFFRGKLYEMLTLLCPLLFYSIILTDTNYLMTTEFYVILPVVALAGLIYYGQVKWRQWLTYALLAAATVGTIYGGIYYLQNTNDREEANYYTFLKEPSKLLGERKLSEAKEVADFIQEISTPETPVAIDDAAAYTIVAYTAGFEGMILPLQKSFVTVIENPALVASYVCLAKRNNPMHNYTVLNVYNLMLMREQKNFRMQRVFESENWIIYSIR
jgi:preprotein translocase subunit SecG